MQEHGVQFLYMRHQGVADVLRELREYQKRRFLKLGRIGGDALEHERQELGPGVIRQNPGGELGNGVAELLGYGFGVLALNTGQENGFEIGLGGGGEAGPEIRVVASELLAEENGGHGSGLRGGRELEKVGEFEGERVGIGLLAEVEEELGLGSLLVGGGHEVGD